MTCQVDPDVIEDDPETPNAAESSQPQRRVFGGVIWVTDSSEMLLNWFGAPTNSWRILLVSSSTARKSPIPNPKLMVNAALPYQYNVRKNYGCEISGLGYLPDKNEIRKCYMFNLMSVLRSVLR